MTFDRVNIEKWLAKSNLSPKTGLELASRELKPNHALRNAIEEWVAHEQEKRQRAPTCSGAPVASLAQSSDVDPPEPEHRVERLLNRLSDGGWRIIAARAGVLAMHTGLFVELRSLARDLLVALVQDSITLCKMSGRNTVLILDVIRAVLCSDPHGRTQKVKGQQVPLGSGFLGEALASSRRAPPSGGIDWEQDAARERADAKGDLRSKQQQVVCVAGDAALFDEGEEVEIFSDEDEDEDGVKIDESASQKKVARKEAMRMIRVEQRCAYSNIDGWPKAGEVFDFGTFSALIVEIGKSLDGDTTTSELKWEASAFATAYHAMEAYAVQILEDALLIAAHSSRAFLLPADLQLARRIRREIA